MRDFNCWKDGNFFYTPLWFEVNCFKRQVEDLEDEHLVEEIMELVYYEIPEVDKITASFMDTGEITEEEREYLINFYVLFSCEDYLVISEDKNE